MPEPAVLQNIIWAVVVSLLLTAVVAAVYYLTAGGGISSTMHTDWNGLFHYVWWTTYRHGIRDVGEGVLAKFGVDTLLAKWQKQPDLRLSGKQMAWRIPVLLIESLALIIIGIWLVSYAGPWAWHHFFHHHHISPVSVGGGVSTIFAGFNWPDFIIGFAAAHVLRAQWRPIGSTISLAFIEPQVDKIRNERLRRVTEGERIRNRRLSVSMPADPAESSGAGWLPTWMKLPDLPPTIRERVSWLLDTRAAVKKHSPWMYRITMALGVIGLGLAGYGEYVLHVIA